MEEDELALAKNSGQNKQPYVSFGEPFGSNQGPVEPRPEGCLRGCLAIALFFGGMLLFFMGSLFGAWGVIPGLGILGLAAAILLSDRDSVALGGFFALALIAGLIWIVLVFINAAAFSR